MEFDPEAESMYRWLSGAVVPRPIAWVSTDGPAGRWGERHDCREGKQRRDDEFGPWSRHGGSGPGIPLEATGRNRS